MTSCYINPADKERLSGQGSGFVMRHDVSDSIPRCLEVGSALRAVLVACSILRSQVSAVGSQVQVFGTRCRFRPAPAPAPAPDNPYLIPDCRDLRPEQCDLINRASEPLMLSQLRRAASLVPMSPCPHIPSWRIAPSCPLSRFTRVHFYRNKSPCVPVRTNFKSSFVMA